MCVTPGWDEHSHRPSLQVLRKPVDPASLLRLAKVMSPAPGSRALIIDDSQWPDDIFNGLDFETERDLSFPPATAQDAIESFKR